MLQAERVGTVLRLSLLDPRQSPPLPAEQHAIQAMEAELSILRAVAETAPVLTWRQIDDGTIVWVNGAYLAALRDEFDPEIAAHWPPAALFDAAALDAVHADSAMPHRVTYFSTASQSPRWFHLQCLRQGCGTLYFATPIDDLVQSEATLQGFIGTLGKTFAQLPTGLAIFDAKRRLVLFNPALIDLTGLGAETLSQRPSLHGFLDALRENQRIPEPRDYKSWRLRIAQLEAAATDGRYQETWTLPTGQSYRVTGQPHPDGAVAFLFEDISSEVSLTRRFRSELDISSAVLNAVDHGLAVFAQDGTLSLWNTRYKEFWSTDPDHALSRITLEDCFALWGLGPGPGDAALMARLRDFVLAGPAREQFAFSLAVVEDGAGAAGITFDIAVRGLPQRATLMEFQRRQISAEKRPEAIKPTDLAG